MSCITVSPPTSRPLARSTLSTSTPPGRAKSSHGSHATPKAAEMIRGSLVRDATNRGVAMVARPLPRAEVVLAAQSFQKRAPSPATLSADIASDRTMTANVPAQSTWRCYGLLVHSSHRSGPRRGQRVSRRQRSRSQFQVAVAALAVAVLAAAILIARNILEPAGHGGGNRAGSGPGSSAGSRPQPPGTKNGSPLSPDWRGSGKPVILAFGGDVHFEGPLAVRLADDPATALDGDVSRLLSGADLSMTNFESALISAACTDPQPKRYV